VKKGAILDEQRVRSDDDERKGEEQSQKNVALKRERKNPPLVLPLAFPPQRDREQACDQAREGSNKGGEFKSKVIEEGYLRTSKRNNGNQEESNAVGIIREELSQLHAAWKGINAFREIGS
jgi:hypothetical protein